MKIQILVYNRRNERKHDVSAISLTINQIFPDSKVRGANMEPIWGRQDPGGPHAGPMNFVIWVFISICSDIDTVLLIHFR